MCSKARLPEDQNTDNQMENCPLVAEDERKKHPTILLKKVEAFLTDQQIGDCLVSQNLQQDVLQNLQDSDINKPKIIVKRNLTPHHMNVIVRIHPKLYATLIKNKRLYIGYTSVKLQPFTLVTQCYKCLAYGHPSKYCRAEKQVCGHCAQDHTNKNSIEHIKCANCLTFHNTNITNGIPPHSAMSNLCPVRTLIKNKLMNRTDYGTD